MREVNQATIDLIREFEGERLTVYKDPIGLPTVGVGHLVKQGEPYKLGQTITKEESEHLLREDLKDAIKCVEDLVTISLSDNEFGALVSFVFNLGCGNFRKSSLLRFVNMSETEKAANEFPKWNKANGLVLKGLTRRREAEKQLFLK